MSKDLRKATSQPNALSGQREFPQWLLLVCGATWRFGRERSLGDSLVHMR